MHLMLHTKFQGHQPFSSEEEDFLSFFYHIWAWWPSWSCDLDRLNKLSFPWPKEAPHEIWLQSAQWFQRRGCLKMLTHTHTPTHMTELTSEPKGSDELKMYMNRNRIWDKGWVLVRPVWAPNDLLQTVPMWHFCCGLFSLDKLFCLYSTLTLGSLLVIYFIKLMSSWCMCSIPIWCLGQKCQFSRALLIHGMGLKVDERQWSGTVTIKFLIKQAMKLRTTSCINNMYKTAQKESQKNSFFTVDCH